jgi:hypothetical protein
MVNEKDRSSFFNRHELEFSPLIGVLMGVVITFLCYIFLIILSVLYGYDFSKGTDFFISDFLFGAISLFIGSFTSLFVVKDKKIQYGIYSGIIFIIYRSLADIFHINILHGNYYLIIISILGYLFITFIGSYLATKTSKIKNIK